MNIEEPLVDAHLELVPRVGTLSGGSLPGGDPQLLSRHADGSLVFELLVHDGALQVTADLLEVLHAARGKGVADLVDLGR